MLLMTVLPLLWLSTRSFECQAVPRKTGRLSTQYRLFRLPSSEDGSVVLYNFSQVSTLLQLWCPRVIKYFFLLRFIHLAGAILLPRALLKCVQWLVV